MTEPKLGTTAPTPASEPPTESTRQPPPTVRQRCWTAGEGPAIGPKRRTIARPHRQIAPYRHGTERPPRSMSSPARTAGRRGSWSSSASSPALPDVTMAEAAKRFSLVKADLAATTQASITVGLTELDVDDTLEDLVARADEAMYRERQQPRSAGA